MKQNIKQLKEKDLKYELLNNCFEDFTIAHESVSGDNSESLLN